MYRNKNNTNRSIQKLQQEIKDLCSTVLKYKREVLTDVSINQHIELSQMMTRVTIMGGINEQVQQHNLRCGSWLLHKNGLTYLYQSL